MLLKSLHFPLIYNLHSPRKHCCSKKSLRELWKRKQKRNTEYIKLSFRLIGSSFMCWFVCFLIDKSLSTFLLSTPKLDFILFFHSFLVIDISYHAVQDKVVTQECYTPMTPVLCAPRHAVLPDSSQYYNSQVV